MTGIDRRTLGRLGAVGAAGLMLPAARMPADIVAEAGTVEWQCDMVGVGTRSPRFRWTLRAGAATARDIVQRGFRLRIVGGAGSGRAGATVFDSGWRQDPSTAFTPQGSLSLVSHAAYDWEVAVEDGAGRRSPPVRAGRFVTGLLDPADWTARWIAARPDGPPSVQAREWDRPIQATAETMPLLRGSFEERRTVAAAFLSVVGLGQYALAIDGAPLGDGDLRPGWSDYRKTVLYDSFDVTDRIKPGLTVMAVMLGNGFYNVEGIEGRYAKLIGSFGQPKLLLQLRLIFADGSDRIVASGADWTVAQGPIRYSSIYGGEDFDARRVPVGWDRDAVPPAGFRPALVVGGPGGALRATGLPPVACIERYDRPVFRTLGESTVVADFGRNFSGRPAITVQGVAQGRTITMIPGELLLPDGRVDQASMTGGKPGYDGIAFAYTADGPARQTWRPQFSYTGFRYLQIEGATKAQIVALVGEFTHLDVPRTGRFDCADTRLVAIHRIIEQALRSNLASVVTDCPHREKLGWLEQIYLNADTASYNRAVMTLYEKMAADMRDAQLPSGLVPSIAPEFVAFVDRDGRSTRYRDSPEWGCAIVLAAWTMYRTYGDRRILTDSWPAMERYTRYLASRATAGVVDIGLGDWYDIGPAKAGESQLTSTGFTGTATLFATLTAMARIAALLGHVDAARRYAVQAAAVRETMNRRFVDSATGRVDRGSQAAQAMALALGIVPSVLRDRTLALLVGDIERRDYHVSAGDVGFHYVVRALREGRRGDVMVRMLRQTTAPSYGYQIAQGATALTEAWNAAPDASQNHFMLGHAESWLYGALGGITIDFARAGPPLMIAPQPVDGVDWADVGLRSVFGDVRCAWRRERDRFVVDVEVPAGATALFVGPQGGPPVLIGSGKRRL